MIIVRLIKLLNMVFRARSVGGFENTNSHIFTEVCMTRWCLLAFRQEDELHSKRSQNLLLVTATIADKHFRTMSTSLLRATEYCSCPVVVCVCM